jgi:hypothetical protein
MGIELIGLHWVYLAIVALLIGCMILRRDTTLLCIVGIFIIGILATDSIASSVSGIFNSFIFAIKELISTILIISIIVAMSRVLTKTGINEVMVSPFTQNFLGRFHRPLIRYRNWIWHCHPNRTRSNRCNLGRRRHDHSVGAYSCSRHLWSQPVRCGAAQPHSGAYRTYRDHHRGHISHLVDE